jgi:hypothetical protein
MDIAAVLIGNSVVKPALPGVEKDLARVKSYLLHKIGGAFETNEIEISLNEDKQTIVKRLQKYARHDYVFTLIAGHGEIRTSINDTVLWIGENTIIPVNELVIGCQRQVIFTDVCRKIVDDRKKVLAHADSLLEEVNFSESIGRRAYRDKFERLIRNTTTGVIKFYSCGPNQSAGDDGSGGVYTNTLLDIAESSSQTRDVYDVHMSSKQIVKAKNPPQLPEENIGRRNISDFPPLRISL